MKQPPHRVFAAGVIQRTEGYSPFTRSIFAPSARSLSSMRAHLTAIDVINAITIVVPSAIPAASTGLADAADLSP